jgi:mRNA-degrading endonuclease RelE of RelBE toxin-antitoxin system
MALPFEVNLTVGAQADLHWFTAYAQRIIVDGVNVHLRDQPNVGSRKIVAMRPNPVAGWELRLGDYRVLYDVDESTHIVTVQAIGEKRGNKLVIQGQEFAEHEGH